MNSELFHKNRIKKGINFEEQTYGNHLSIALFTSFGLNKEKKLILEPERELYTQQRHLLGELTNSTDAMQISILLIEKCCPFISQIHNKPVATAISSTNIHIYTRYLTLDIFKY